MNEPLPLPRRRLSVHVAHRRTLRPGLATLGADRAPAVAAVGAEKRASGSRGLPQTCTGATLLASPRRIREKPALAYDGTSESLVAAK
jgi:hypothetical protein